MENSSRVIKFRAWDKVKKRMLEDVSTGTVRVYGDFNELDHTSYSKNCVFMQYIGLKDKNGTEIYEGDILESTYKNQYGTYKKRSIVEQSDIYQGNGDYDDETIVGGWVIKTDTLHPLKSFKIIGNIYENPELIK